MTGERMTGVDATMLYMERPSHAMNAGTLMILNTATMPGGYTFERFRDRHLALTRKLEYARRRVVEVPLGLAHPAWAVDDDLDVDYHVQRIVLADPASNGIGSGLGDGRAAACQILADELKKPLDRHKPMWRLFVVENVDVDRIGAIFVVHHVDFDGVSGAALASFAFGPAETLDLADDANDVLSHCFRGTPSRRQLLGWAARQRVERWRAIPSSTVAVTRALRRRAGAREGHRIPRIPFLRGVPPTPWSRGFGDRRAIVTFDVDLRALKARARDDGLTLHDFMLNAFGGALRDELIDRDALPDRPLVCACGVSLHDDGPDRRAGQTANRWSTMRIRLPTNVADPVARGRMIRAETAAKKSRRTQGGIVWPYLAEHLSANLFRLALGINERLHLGRHMRSINCVLSTVRGPEDVLYFAGNEVTEMYAITSIFEAEGMLVCPFSYRGRMFVTIHVEPDTVSDPRGLAERLEAHLGLPIVLDRDDDLVAQGA